jgi:hypothetical protein
MLARMTTLGGFRDHCRAMADAPDVEPKDRDLWIRLADEIDSYLDDGARHDDVDVDADSLFGIDGAT